METKKLKKFKVTKTIIENYETIIEAENETQAVEIAKNLKNEDKDFQWTGFEHVYSTIEYHQPSNSE